MRIHENPPLNIVLFEPQIPPNTGNVARLCAATKCHLILIGRLGFELTDSQLKRAGLDYWKWVSWEYHEDADAFLESLRAESVYCLSVHAEKPYTSMRLQRGDYLFFGKETTGLPGEWLNRFAERTFTIPMWETRVRSLNLGSSVAIVVYDALRNLKFF